MQGCGLGRGENEVRRTLECKGEGEGEVAGSEGGGFTGRIGVRGKVGSWVRMGLVCVCVCVCSARVVRVRVRTKLRVRMSARIKFGEKMGVRVRAGVRNEA